MFSFHFLSLNDPPKSNITMQVFFISLSYPYLSIYSILWWEKWDEITNHDVPLQSWKSQTHKCLVASVNTSSSITCTPSRRLVAVFQHKRAHYRERGITGARWEWAWAWVWVWLADRGGAGPDTPGLVVAQVRGGWAAYLTTEGMRSTLLVHSHHASLLLCSPHLIARLKFASSVAGDALSPCPLLSKTGWPVHFEFTFLPPTHCCPAWQHSQLLVMPLSSVTNTNLSKLWSWGRTYRDLTCGRTHTSMHQHLPTDWHTHHGLS